MRLAVLEGRRFWLRAAAWTLGFVGATSALVVLAQAVIRWEKPCPDFVCFWAAGTLLAAGQSPYDFARLAQIQQAHGWSMAADGLGFYEFLPYYYPPSLLAPLSVLLLPLGFPTARLTWLVLNTELLFLTGYILRNAVAGVPRAVPMALVPIFVFSVLCVLVGQLSVIVLFLMAAALTLLQRGWDRSAGWLLAWMSIKPQLSTLLAIATLVWLARQRRWRGIAGFAAGSALLVVVSTWFVPTWPLQIVRALVDTPVVTQTFPWVGTTWLLVLRSTGLEPWVLWVVYAAVALPFCWAVLRTALQHDSTIDEVFAVSILAAFFVAPTARPYDQPVLIIPLLVLLGRRLPPPVGAALLPVFVLLPYVQLFLFSPPRANMPVHVWFFWIPLLLASLWFGSQALVRTPQPAG